MSSYKYPDCIAGVAELAREIRKSEHAKGQVLEASRAAGRLEDLVRRLRVALDGRTMAADNSYAGCNAADAIVRACARWAETTGGDCDYDAERDTGRDRAAAERAERQAREAVGWVEDGHTCPGCSCWIIDRGSERCEICGG